MPGEELIVIDPNSTEGHAMIQLAQQEVATSAVDARSAGTAEQLAATMRYLDRQQQSRSRAVAGAGADGNDVDYDPDYDPDYDSDNDRLRYSGSYSFMHSIPCIYAFTT